MFAQYGSVWLIVCPLVFLAGFVDAVAGGGGLISIPAYTLAGLPMHTVLGSNKFAMSFGTASSVWRFAKSGNIRWNSAVYAGIGSIVGSLVGTNLALLISDAVLRMMMMCVLPCVAIFLALQKNFGTEQREKDLSPKKIAVLSGVIGIGIGCYDGLIGPGTGTFLILAFTGVLGYNMLLSSGCAKVSNFCSNITSMLVFLFSGKVLFPVAIPAAVCAILGNQVGSRLAIKGGAKVVRSLIFVVLGLMFVKMIFEFFA